MLSLFRRHVSTGYQILFPLPGPLAPFALYSPESEPGGHFDVFMLRMLCGPLGGNEEGRPTSPLRWMLPFGGGQRLRCILSRL